jgi:hypothetical protein
MAGPSSSLSVPSFRSTSNTAYSDTEQPSLSTSTSASADQQSSSQIRNTSDLLPPRLSANAPAIPTQRQAPPPMSMLAAYSQKEKAALGAGGCAGGFGGGFGGAFGSKAIAVSAGCSASSGLVTVLTAVGTMVGALAGSALCAGQVALGLHVADNFTRRNTDDEPNDAWWNNNPR